MAVMNPNLDAKEQHQIAISARSLKKEYRLYNGPREQLFDMLGLYRILPFKPRKFATHEALSGVDLTIGIGERVGVIGRNGAGKTTLLRLITQSTVPTSGELFVNGNVQALMQVGLGFHPEFSGLQNIRASLSYSGLSAGEQLRAENDIIDFCELGAYLDQPLKTYSLGMQSRLQFACATAIRPEILVVDEILGAGDAYFSVKSSRRMENLTKSGCTLILVSHSMAHILQFCDRCIWVEGGRIIDDGTPRKIVGRYEVFMEELSAGIREASNEPLKGMKLPGKALKLKDDFGQGVTEFISSSMELRSDSKDEHKATLDGDADCSITVGQPERDAIDLLDDGEQVLRWPSDPGPKLVNFQIHSDQSTSRRIYEGSDVLFRCLVRNDTENRFSCRYQLTIFSLDNRRISRMLSPADNFTGGLEIREVNLWLKPCLLGIGSYYVNFAVLDGDALRAGAPIKRYDLVSRFGDFDIISSLDYREGCVFNHPSVWTLPK